jgi:hypothetical protein
VDAGDNMVEVAADTMPTTLENGVSGQIAVSDAENLSLPNPLNIFGDQDLTDAVITPWIKLLIGAPGALTGSTFRLRLNFGENPSFNFADLDFVLMHLEYSFD